MNQKNQATCLYIISLDSILILSSRLRLSILLQIYRIQILHQEISGENYRSELCTKVLPLSLPEDKKFLKNATLKVFCSTKTNYIACALILNAFSGLMVGTTRTPQKEVEWCWGEYDGRINLSAYS
jgi:hypothetical protein